MLISLSESFSSILTAVWQVKMKYVYDVSKSELEPKDAERGRTQEEQLTIGPILLLLFNLENSVIFLGREEKMLSFVAVGKYNKGMRAFNPNGHTRQSVSS